MLARRSFGHWRLQLGPRCLAGGGRRLLLVIRAHSLARVVVREFGPADCPWLSAVGELLLVPCLLSHDTVVDTSHVACRLAIAPCCVALVV